MGDRVNFWTVGEIAGSTVGTLVGGVVGGLLGCKVGTLVGGKVGGLLGYKVGTLVGESVGAADAGMLVAGDTVGPYEPPGQIDWFTNKRIAQ